MDAAIGWVKAGMRHFSFAGTIMTYAYYPGCTLKNKAEDLDFYARESAQILGFELSEIPEWQCCGGTYPLSKQEVAPKLSSVRALACAESQNKKIVTLCSACYNVLKQVNNDIKTDAAIKEKANTYLKADNICYEGNTEVLHYLEVLRDEIGWEKVKGAVAKANGGEIWAVTKSGMVYLLNSKLESVLGYPILSGVTMSCEHFVYKDSLVLVGTDGTLNFISNTGELTRIDTGIEI